MGLIRNKPASSLDLTEIGNGLHSLFGIHESRASNFSFWPEMEDTWENLISEFESIRDHSSVGTMGTLLILKDAESQKKNPDPHIRIGARFLHIVTVNRLTSGNLSDVIEDFYLKTYSRPAHIKVYNDYCLWLGSYKWLDRVILGNPSPRKIAKDFNKFVSMLKDTWIIATPAKDGVIFQIMMTRSEDDSADYQRDIAIITRNV